MDVGKYIKLLLTAGTYFLLDGHELAGGEIAGLLAAIATDMGVKGIDENLVRDAGRLTFLLNKKYKGWEKAVPYMSKILPKSWVDWMSDVVQGERDVPMPPVSPVLQMEEMDGSPELLRRMSMDSYRENGGSLLFQPEEDADLSMAIDQGRRSSFLSSTSSDYLQAVEGSLTPSVMDLDTPSSSSSSGLADMLRKTEQLPAQMPVGLIPREYEKLVAKEQLARYKHMPVLKASPLVQIDLPGLVREMADRGVQTSPTAMLDAGTEMLITALADSDMQTESRGNTDMNTQFPEYGGGKRRRQSLDNQSASKRLK